MEPIYIFGHRNPDTDSVCAAIALAYLKNKLGFKCEPRILSNINNETKFVLDYFNFDIPKILDGVRIQITDLKFNKQAVINKNDSIFKAATYMIENNITGVPLIDEERHVSGYVNLKDLAREFVIGDSKTLNTSLDNIVKIVDAKIIVKATKNIKGDIIVAGYDTQKFLETVVLKTSDIIIVGNREKIIRYAIKSKVQLIIQIGEEKIDAELKNLAKKNNVSIITTSLLTYDTVNKLKLANYVYDIITNKDPICVDRFEYLDDFKKKINKYGHTNYPVLNNKNQCVGMITLKDINNYEKKQVILVDHNQNIQSVEGIEEAEIIEIIDHHNVGVMSTPNPINFRIMPIGSTCSIIYQMYIENNVPIPKKIAGLLLSAIISDTLVLTSPTTTELDKEIAKKLSSRCNLKIKKYSNLMFKAASSLKNRTLEDIIYSDYKEFNIKDNKILISQIFSLNIEEIKKDINKYIGKLNELSKTKYDYVIMSIIDITKNGSYLIFSNSSKELLSEMYGNINQLSFINGLLSRKKQLVPSLHEALEKF